MKKQFNSFASLLILVACFQFSCSKDNNDNPPATKTKTELLTKATWKFEKAEAGGLDISSNPALACYIDNTITFTSTNATINEGANICTPPAQSTPFPWSFKNNETVLNVSATLLPGGTGDFDIITLNETNLVVSQNIIIPPSPVAVKVIVTFKH